VGPAFVVILVNVSANRTLHRLTICHVHNVQLPFLAQESGASIFLFTEPSLDEPCRVQSIVLPGFLPDVNGRDD
jgi:hypothetical protein